MKTVISIISFLFLAISLQAQSPAYQKAMGKAMGQMAEAKSSQELQSIANTFDRIGSHAPEEYLPNYYAALNMIHQSFRMAGGVAEKDALLDEAMERVNEAKKQSPGNVELEIMTGYILMAKMVADPGTRGQSYSPRIYGSFGKAMSMAPDNPRATVMMARMELGTSQFFGSEPTKACGLAQKSLLQFEAEKPNGFEPTWGKDQAEEILGNCGE